jgi:non-specific serine/threonine protein kinase/serine/threonine-protein kinase
MTTSPAWEEIKKVLGAALERDPAERVAYLDEACANDPALRAEVESLLAAYGQAQALSESPWPARALRQEPQAGPIGPYRLIRKLGEGGMGEVWLGEQTHPVRRHVALKVIRAGMDTKEFIARFEAERQALAMMDHPAIAKVFDAGETNGLPFFAMEQVQGDPITNFCDAHTLTNEERIALFLLVCDGVQHAHEKGIIHRDLKPSNVLVAIQGERPAPKIIDFGVAKAIGGGLTDKTMLTELGVLIGTPEYMSPEQADLRGLDLDTRSDVYALGVMLYELLTGALPFETKVLRSGGFDEIRRRIREVEPPRPSTRVRTMGADSAERARHRKTDPAHLAKSLQGDLDWIVMKALEKERSRRYRSPSELAEDLGRCLRLEPVQAHAPSARYRAMKFVRRHRLGVAAASMIALSLAGGAVASTVAMVRAHRAESRARADAEAKGRVADFLKDLFKVSDPDTARGNNVTARELLDKAAGSIEGPLSAEPAVQAELAEIMGEVYVNLGLYARAEPLLRKAVEVRRRALGPEHVDTLDSMRQLANSTFHQGRYAEAEKLNSEALDTSTRVLGPEDPMAISCAMERAGILYREGRFADAEQLYSGTLEIQKRVLGPENVNTLACMGNLATVYSSQGRYAEAERLYDQTFEAMTRVLGPENSKTLMTMGSLVKTHLNLGRYVEAERLALQCLEIMKRVLGPDHPHTLTVMTNLALAYQGQSRYADAERLDSEILGIQKRVLGPEHDDVLWTMNNLALAYQSQGRYDEAERLHLQTLEIRRRVLGPTHPNTLASLYNLACIAAKRGDRTRAMSWLRQDVDGGDPDYETMAGDRELQSLHGPAFDALLAQVRRNAAAARAPVAAPGTNPPPPPAR